MNDALEPLDIINGFPVRPGLFEQTGVTPLPFGVNFTIHSKSAIGCELLLFHRMDSTPYAVLPFPENYRIGHVYSMMVFDLDIETFEYAFRLDGPYEPEKGLLFNPDHILIDPYAKAITGQSTWGAKAGDNYYHARVVRDDFYWGTETQPTLPLEDLVIYEMHVRGFTKMANDVSQPGTFKGIMEKIPYLKELGVNALELMPIFEFDELADERIVDGTQLLNYWGYNTVSFFAPNTSYSSAIEYNQEGLELKQLVKELHANGIEIILDVVFNHTAEGNEDGPFISFKGFDNDIYYMLTPDGYYYNFSGCGNTMNCNHPVVQRLIIDCLRYWVEAYRIDGFRFDLASILGRNEDGSPMDKPPLLQTIACDPILGNTKLIAEAWDAGGLYQVGSFPSFHRWIEWNGRYRDDLREFLKGGIWGKTTAIQRLLGSPDIYLEDSRKEHASINFLTCHDGFTLYDLYAYNEKHNEANGWNNTDGTNDNRSWNCGEEGETTNKEVLSLRRRMMKNACATLMCSRGTPMFLAGDEFCNTQYGNNNPYCQDNEISWLDWSFLKKNTDMYQFFKYMIHFRHDHPALKGNRPHAKCGLPEISIFGEHPDKNMDDPDSHVIGLRFACHDKNTQKDDIVYFILNAFWEGAAITLPATPDNHKWYLAVNTGDSKQPFHDTPIVYEQADFWLKERSVAVFIGI